MISFWVKPYRPLVFVLSFQDLCTRPGENLRRSTQVRFSAKIRFTSKLPCSLLVRHLRHTVIASMDGRVDSLLVCCTRILISSLKASWYSFDSPFITIPSGRVILVIDLLRSRRPSFPTSCLSDSSIFERFFRQARRGSGFLPCYVNFGNLASPVFSVASGCVHSGNQCRLNLF